MCEVEFYVAPVNAYPILDLGDYVQLGLVKQVYTIQQEDLIKDMLKQTVFKDLEMVSHHSAGQLHTCDKPSQVHMFPMN